MSHLITLTGPSGCGKTTIANYLATRFPDRFQRCITSTTRNLRKGEAQGVDYYFLGREEFQDGDFLETTEFNGQLYGLMTSEVRDIIDSGKNALFSCDPSGAANATKRWAGSVLKVYIDVPEALARERMIGRGDPQDKVESRLLNDAKVFKFDPYFYDLFLRSGTGSICFDAATVLGAMRSRV
jgi:guanylate kinase